MNEDYVVAHGWFGQAVNYHTCGTGSSGHYGAHEPGCGFIPMVPVDRVLALLDAETRGPKFPCPDCKGEGWIVHTTDGDPDPYPCRCNRDATPFPRARP